MDTRQNRKGRRAFLKSAGAAAGGALLASCSPGQPAAGSEPAQAVDWKAVTKLGQEGSLAPQGRGRGIYPGRVVWAHNPEAAKWDGQSGQWWQDANTSTGAVSEMLSAGLRQQSGESGDEAAWNALFQHFNRARGREQAGYQPGQKIAVKINLNNCGRHAYRENGSFVAPQLVQALLEQLVLKAGVSAEDITVYDAIRFIPDCIFDRCQSGALKGVKFEDFTGGDGRMKAERDPESQMHWSKDVHGNPTFLPTCVTQADYLINVASLKGHNLAGVTLTAKNHFGTIMSDLNGAPTQQSPQGANLHGSVAAVDFNMGKDWSWLQRPMRTYNALVDLMGHADLGEKTLLYMLDGLYGAPYQEAVLDNKCRWQSAPFNGRWTSSLFLSQDGVAIDSVGLDFLWAEPSIRAQKNVLPPDSTADNYLHEASLAGEPPSGTRYDPMQTGKALPGLGVHEHWKDAGEKKYTRNLKTGEGIELVSIA